MAKIRNAKASANGDDLYDIIPTGSKAILMVYGAATSNGSSDLYWGSDADGWTLVRSVVASTYEYSRINAEYIGDGSSRFKVETSNQGGQAIVRYWFEYILREL